MTSIGHLHIKEHHEKLFKCAKNPSTMVDLFALSAKMAVLSADHLRITSLCIFVYINEWISL